MRGMRTSLQNLWGEYPGTVSSRTNYMQEHTACHNPCYPSDASKLQPSKQTAPTALAAHMCPPTSLLCLQVTGTRHTAYQKTVEKEYSEGQFSSTNSINSRVSYVSISAMPQYIHKSPEELQFEDRMSGSMPGGPWVQPAPAAGLGAPGAPATSSGFGYGNGFTGVNHQMVAWLRFVRHLAHEMCAF
jgi:hypothetical protein